MRVRSEFDADTPTLSDGRAEPRLSYEAITPLANIRPDKLATRVYGARQSAARAHPHRLRYGNTWHTVNNQARPAIAHEFRTCLESRSRPQRYQTVRAWFFRNRFNFQRARISSWLRLCVEFFCVSVM